MKQIICIGRQYGSGGHVIGEQLSKRLGWPLYDKEILAAAARKLNVTAALLEKRDESQLSNLLFNLLNRSGEADDFEEKLYVQQKRFLRKQAEKGSCIIIGRCANEIFKNDPGMMSVFIHAPFNARIERLMETENMTEEEAIRAAKLTDKKRSNYYEYRTNAHWSDPGQYHMMIDRTLLGVDKTAELLYHIVMKRGEEDED